MGRRSDHSRDEIRQMALTAAESIVVGGGYKALSARKVAAKIGYTVGTLYLIFENLDDLGLQVNGRTLDELVKLLEKRVQGQGKGEDVLFLLATTYIEYAEHNTARWNMLFDYVTEKGDELPPWYEEKITKVFKLVESALPDTNHEQRPDLNMQVARVLWASVHGICMLKIRQRIELAGGQTTEEMAHMLISNFLQGMQS